MMRVHLKKSINCYYSIKNVNCNDPQAFIAYQNDMDDIYENMEEYNPNKERKILILFDDLIVEILIHKKTSTNSN